jgi:hydrogenase maturation protein HypF
VKYYLSNEREIVNRVDDSIIKVIEEKPLFIRRARGYATIPIKIDNGLSTILSVGSGMNNTICLTGENNYFISEHIGNTQALGTLENHKKIIEEYIKFTKIQPEIITCDLHPEYNVLENAKELAKEYKTKLVQVQHHKSHVASVAAEHGLKDYVGIAMDGTGHGTDETIWGGEVFSVTDDTNFERIGHLELHPMIGGDSSVKNPKKMLVGILSKILDEMELIDLELFSIEETNLYLKQLDENFNVAFTSSAGRVLDAASALLNICDSRDYDGRPAMLLESIATEPLELEPLIKEEDGKKILMTTPLFKFLLNNLDKDKGRLAATAQTYLAKGMLKIAKEIGNQVVFSGGVAYNKMITEYMIKNGVLLNKEVPPGDGGISFGQAWIASKFE